VSAQRRQPESFGRDLAATAAVAGYSLVVAMGFARVFSGWGFMVDLAAVVIVGHGSSFAMRRARVSGWLAVPLMTMLLLWLVTALHYGDTLRWLLPSGETWHQIDLEIGLVRDKFQTEVAPVFYGAGWATLAAFAVVIAVVMSDAFAFRAEARGEALVPGGVLFVFIAALGSPRLRIGLTALLLAAGVVAVIALRALHDRSRRVELTSARHPMSMVIPAALATAAAVAVLAGVVGPRIPGAQAEPLYETRGRGGGITEVVSPLVDIKSRLTNRGSTELFRVNADASAYWRATTLPEFNGSQWRLPTRALERVDGAFGTVGGSDTRIRQQIQVLSLGGQLVPAAADPIEADGFSGGERLDLRVNRDTNTLLAPGEIQPGDLFTVVSSTPDLTPDRLRSVDTISPPDPIFIELPDDLPDVVAQLAAEVTAGAATEYDAAIALQDWFRSEFRYSLEVQSGHGSNAIESFLRERVGYCEQFSGTYAAMARTLGIPSRVAVGFTPGVLNDEGWYSVLGKNAHAWPELWFDGIGWVAFEPTPGRGAPGAEQYTNVPSEQDASGPDLTGTGGDPDLGPNPTTPSTVVPPPTTVAPRRPSTVENGSQVPGLTPGRGTPDSGTTSGGSVPWTVLIALAALGMAAVMPAVVRRVRTRAARGRGPIERVQAAWAHARAAAETAGVRGRPSMTAREWASATAIQLPVAARPMGSLAEVVDRVSFSRPGTIDLERSGSYGATLGHDCELWSDQIGRIAVDTLSTRQRIKRYFTDLR
jgi:transglutaminase-like putative cysteine protease